MTPPHFFGPKNPINVNSIRPYLNQPQSLPNFSTVDSEVGESKLHSKPESSNCCRVVMALLIQNPKRVPQTQRNAPLTSSNTRIEMCFQFAQKKKKKLRRIHKLHKLTIKPVETEHLQEKKPQNGWGKCTFLEHLLETGWPTDLEAARRWGHLRNAAYTAIPVRSYSRSTRKSTNCIYPNDQIAKLHLKFLFFSVNAECFPQQQ